MNQTDIEAAVGKIREEVSSQIGTRNQKIEELALAMQGIQQEMAKMNASLRAVCDAMQKQQRSIKAVDL